jgi:site-specific DNA-methyltransferase (adenine-specific)
MGNSYKHDKAGFMGAEWDSFVPGPEVWKEVYRVMKPGAHLLAFTGSRTMDLMGFSIRFAGFEMRETLMAWLYSQGFPKSLDASKAVDEALGAERVVSGSIERPAFKTGASGYTDNLAWSGERRDIPATPEAQQWQGWGSALKPAFEPVLLARKPLVGTTAEALLSGGTGALNIDGCRVGTEERFNNPTHQGVGAGTFATGRWPPNVLMTHHPECVEDGVCHQECMAEQLKAQTGSDVTRFFPQFYYSPKASRAERETGAPEDAERVTGAEAVKRKKGSKGMESPRAGAGRTAEDVWNNHPTVKPVDVMRWLVRLVAPPGSIVLDPFNGSGTTGVAALHEGARYVGCEREERFVEISTGRLIHAEKESTGLPPVKLAPKERERTEVVPLPDSEALRKAFDLTDEIKVERKPGGLASKDFKRLVAKSLKR